MSRPATPVLERIIPKLDMSGDCWLWTGALGQTGGYGVVRNDDGRARFVHRVLYELLVEPVPPGLDLDHLCRVRCCANPDHLEPVTRQTNVDRGAHAAGRPRKTHCKHGHLITRTTDGRARDCRPCANERNRRYRASQKEAA